MKSLVTICAALFYAIHIGECTRQHDCRRGYVKNRDGECVPERDCDDPEPMICPSDQEYKVCGCVKSCCNRGSPEACAKQCLKGCFCRDGLVRDKNGRCIKLEDCPKNGPGGNCKKDEQYYENKPDCKNTCENYNNPGVRCDAGKPGCFCKEGLVKRKDGKCVTPQECPKGGNCKKDEQYYENKPDCKNTCENYNNPGIRCAAGKPGCFCKEGLVKRKDGKCVRPEECSKKCGVNEVYVSCAKPETCNTCKIRGNCNLKRCIPGCDCMKGFYRGGNGLCIHESQCPRNGTRECKDNEEFTTCGTACPDTCENYGKPRACTLQCVEGCFCKRGLVRDSNNRCIAPERCDRGNYHVSVLLPYKCSDTKPVAPIRRRGRSRPFHPRARSHHPPTPRPIQPPRRATCFPRMA